MMPMALLPAVFLLPEMRQMTIAAMTLCLLSFIDDRYGLPVIARLLAHSLVVLAVIVLGDLSASPVALGVFVLLLLWGVNLFNFMDGADGLAGGMAAIGFLVYGIASWQGAPTISTLCLLLSVTATGFLLFNFSPAKVFLGDAGSIPLGFLAVAIGLFGWHRQLWPAWFPILVFSPFFVDATVILLKRLFKGERVWLAHRDHYYQRLVRMHMTHRRLALGEYALMAATGLSALAMLRFERNVQFVGLLFWVSLYAVAMITIDSRWQRHQAKETKT